MFANHGILKAYIAEKCQVVKNATLGDCCAFKTYQSFENGVSDINMIQAFVVVAVKSCHTEFAVFVKKTTVELYRNASAMFSKLNNELNTQL